MIEDDEGRVGLLSEGEFGGWPSLRDGDETDEEEEIDVFQGVAAHLQEGSVAIFIEVGAEKLRYLTGHAIAVNSKGQTAEVRLSEIYDLAKVLGDEVTEAEW